MNYRCLCFLVGLSALVSLAQGQVAPNSALAKAKTDKTWTPARTAEVAPPFRMLIPFHSSVEIHGKAFPSDTFNHLTSRYLVTALPFLSAMKGSSAFVELTFVERRTSSNR